jgi:hypothetical protein
MALSITARNSYLATPDLQAAISTKNTGLGSALALNPVNEHVADVARMFYSHMGGKPNMVEQRAYIGNFTSSRLLRHS